MGSYNPKAAVTESSLAARSGEAGSAQNRVDNRLNRIGAAE